MLNGYKTIIGLLIAAVPQFTPFFGFEAAPGFTEQATEIAESVITLAGLCFALYGRLVAVVPGWFVRFR